LRHERIGDHQGQLRDAPQPVHIDWRGRSGKRAIVFDYPWSVDQTHAMSKRLQVLLPDREFAEIQQCARRQQMTTAEWARQALRTARRDTSGVAARKKLDVVRAAGRRAFPSAEIDQMLDEIERGYLGESAH
jgi:hypothetical protein